MNTFRARVALAGSVALVLRRRHHHFRRLTDQRPRLGRGVGEGVRRMMRAANGSIHSGGLSDSYVPH